MIAGSAKKHQRKKRDAAYYREYRRRKKMGAENVLPFPVAPNFPNSVVQKTNYKVLFLTVFAAFLTGILIYLSAPFYMNGHSKPMAYLLASLVEISLLFLLSMQTTGHFDKLAKYFLIGSLSLYALVPIALNPVNLAKVKMAIAQREDETKELKIKSIQAEIQTRTDKAALLKERGRVTLAQSEFQKVAELQSELRNTATTIEPVVITGSELESSYALGLQRLLLMLCNLYFVHSLVAARRLQPLQQRAFNKIHVANAVMT